ncbi:hypothetical protein ACHAW5_000684 [Stephanodiscus triporus]|uniref:Uncharacterized protein n=1 Tax=Stephanodiscus triporus TaxID=2934178 RepID=A0ABD3NC96_9STRA
MPPSSKVGSGNGAAMAAEDGSSSAALVLPKHSPTILNASNHTMVVFQERGTFYNCQVLRPGEAVSMTPSQTGGRPFLPYRVRAIVGDDSAIPSSRDSAKNLVKVTAVPAAFVAGCLATAISAGMLVGPSVALAPLVSGMVVGGVVIDSTAIAAGMVVSTRANAVSDFVLKDKPNGIFGRTERLRPGRRYLVVTGGLDDGIVNVKEVKEKDFAKRYVVKVWKAPLSDGAMKKAGVFVDDGEEDEAGFVDGGEGEEVGPMGAKIMHEPEKPDTNKKGWFKK